MEAQVGQFLLGCKCPVSRGIVVQVQDPLDDLPVAIFLQNVLQSHHQRWGILRVDSLALWKIINEEVPSWSPKIEARTFPADFCTRNFLGRGEPLCRHSIDCCFVSSDITRFRPWSSIAPDRKSFGSRRKNSKSCSGDWHRWRFWSVFRHFGTQFAESFCISKSSWMMDPIRSREMLSCSDIDLAEIRRYSKISSLIWSISPGGHFLGRPGRGASQVEKSPCLNWATQFLTVAYDGACSLMFLSEWREFPSAPCLAGKKKKLDDSSHLDVVEIARVAWHASLQHL